MAILVSLSFFSLFLFFLLGWCASGRWLQIYIACSYLNVSLSLHILAGCFFYVITNTTGVEASLLMQDSDCIFFAPCYRHAHLRRRFAH